MWNGEHARFTGWCDVPLTVKGRVEAVGAGQLLRSRGFRAAKVDAAFTSELQRAHETCELALASMAGHRQNTWSSDRIRRDARLNERHYGAVQGFYKNDMELRAKFGDDTIREWRRSMDAKPPPISEDHPEWQPPPAPATESLADCQQRVLECFNDRIAPALFEEAIELPPEAREGEPEPEGSDPSAGDRTVVVVAHANTIRSLMAAFDRVPDGDVPKLHVPNSVPILYRFDRKTRDLLSTRLQGAAGGSHARWLLSPENYAEIHEAIQPGGMLTRAIFESWDLDGNRELSASEIEAGIRNHLADEYPSAAYDTATIAVAKKLLREISAVKGATVSLEEFERRAAQGVADIEQSVVRLNSQDMLGEEESMDAWERVGEPLEYYGFD